MPTDTADIRSVFEATPLESAALAEVAVLDTSETVVAFELAGIDPLAAWRCARERVRDTGRWPVLTLVGAGRSGAWSRVVASEDYFSRFYFEEEERDRRRDDEPETILQAAQAVDVAGALAAIPDDTTGFLFELLDVALAETRRRFGKAPVVDDPGEFLLRELIYDQHALERWFFEWERRNGTDALQLAGDGLAHLEWFAPPPEEQALLLLPSARHWEAPAYIHWFGALRCNSQTIVALLREWHARFGAELVAHYGTILQFGVARPPATPEAAFELAWQQHVVAPCTTLLPGVSVRNHARALLHAQRWFLHERP
ncbi:DUF4253 domain-containing protein [Tahibacter amnicola]|uniref:DUF4253 domain-containing protein n=1 Tax=Tahibacter amnicola TaxID=2976241 RepID=A0ABY6B7D1_9GAMM|nr:DUF4253 domain-containing protein [Tahibacter amnicola]UXI65805.1 DUF4253 domain-containing protein [Tahibacter amnicola]